MSQHDSGYATDAIGRDWTEDFPHENGRYQCRCVACENMFLGHKRRVICKRCSLLSAVAKCSACGATESEPCRGNCERRLSTVANPKDVQRYTQMGSGMVPTFQQLNGERFPAGDWVKASDYDALYASRSARRISYVVRCGGECPQDWLCEDIPEVQKAFCEALYGRVEDADAHIIGQYLASVQKMVTDELRWTFEDGWLRVTKLNTNHRTDSRVIPTEKT